MFDRFFNAGNPLWVGMGRIFDVFVLNVLWLLCCLPVFTIGPSTTAFFYAMINLVRGEDNPVSRDFFRSFRQNFKQGICLGIPMTAVGAFLYLDITMSRRAGTGIYTFFMVFFAILFLMWAFLALYVFPLLAKFDKKNGELLAWAFTLSLRHLGKTLLMLLVLVFGLWACHILPGLIFIAFGLVGQFCAGIIASILKPHLPDVHGEEEPLKPLTFREQKESLNPLPFREQKEPLNPSPFIEKEDAESSGEGGAPHEEE